MMTRFAVAALLAGGALLPTLAIAQSGIEGRVGRLEGEMRAVQRKVFPGGAGATLQPDIAAPAPSAEAPGTPATSALADLTTRVSSLEQQLTSLTGQVEQAGYRTRQLQEQFDAYKRDTDARLKTLEGNAATPAAPVATPGADEAAAPVAIPLPRPSRTPPRPATPTPATTPATTAGEDDAAPPDTGAATATVVKPATGDAAEDGYLYGYRLWQAKRYPEAEAQLKKVVATYPKSRRASYAQNLLGRAYLDDGKPSLASMAFYDNYKKMPDGERAPDSLYHLAQALVTLKKPADACKVYDELTDVYGAKISQSMKADVAKGRTTAKCQ